MKALFLAILLLLAGATDAAAQEEATAVEHDTEYVYLMPCKSGAVATVRKLSAVETRRGRQFNLINFTSWELAFAEAVDVFPAREGEVITVDRDFNRVIVRHADGTMARYLAVEDISVEEGAHATLSTRIGRTSQAANNTWVVGFETYYKWLNPNTDPKKSVNARYTYLEQYLDPVIRTSRGKIRFTEGESYRAVRRKRFVFWR